MVLLYGHFLISFWLHFRPDRSLEACLELCSFITWSLRKSKKYLQTARRVQIPRVLCFLLLSPLPIRTSALSIGSKYPLSIFLLPKGPHSPTSRSSSVGLSPLVETPTCHNVAATKRSGRASLALPWDFAEEYLFGTCPADSKGLSEVSILKVVLILLFPTSIFSPFSAQTPILAASVDPIILSSTAQGWGFYLSSSLGFS